MRIAGYGGVILALPVIMWQIWRFIVPALHAKEKRYAIPFILSSVVLFLLGGALAYLTLGRRWSSSSPGAATTSPRRSRSASTCASSVLMVAAFGVGFQFPVLLVFLQLVGVITPQQLLEVLALRDPRHRRRRRRDHAVRRPDLAAALALPMLVLYFIAVGIGYLFQRRKRRADAASCA